MVEEDTDPTAVEVDVDTVSDAAIQIWDWALAPPCLRDGFDEPYPVLIYIPARYFGHPMLHATVERAFPGLKREEGDGAICIAGDFDFGFSA